MFKFTKIKLLILISTTIFLIQCKKDFDVNDNWKDISVVYGLLNSTDSVHYIRLSKAFLGDQDAYVMAQVSDSLYYQNATVKIEERINGSLTNTYNCVKIDTIREDGIFAHNNVVYRAIGNLSTNSNALYKLVINANDNEISSETALIQDFTVYPINNPVSMSATTNKLSIVWNTPPMGRLYETVVRFFYYDITATDTTKKYLDIPLGSKTSNTKEGGESMSTELIGSNFLYTVANTMPNNPQLIKRVVAKGSIEVRISVGSDDMYTYIQVTQPSSGIVSEKPAYSNISNGLGLFSSRYLKISPISKPSLSQKTIDSLAAGIYTGVNGKNLKFIGNSSTTSIWTSFP